MLKRLLGFGVGWLAFTIAVFAQTAALDQRVSVNKTAATIQEVLSELASTYQLSFSFSNDLVHLQQKVSVKVNQQPLREVLDAILKDKDIRYAVIGSQIILQPGRSAKEQHATISGYLTDVASGEALIGATVREAISRNGTTTNRYGFYSLTLPRGRVRIAASYISYFPVSHEFELRQDTTLALRLTTASQSLGEVTITPEENQQIKPLGSINIPIQRLRAVPTLFGEPDIIKALALTPGVSTGNEGSTGLLVRGGSPDQNLILLDEATVYNAAHLFGFVSIFNPDAIKNVDLYKAGFPARFGGRLSSVLDITMKEGNNQEMKGEASIGLISSRFNLEGPIRDKQTSFMLSARSSYLSLFLLPTYIPYKKGATDAFFNYWLYDINGKVNHTFKDGGRLFFSVYNGNDFWTAYDGSYSEKSKFALNWGNTTATTRYSRTLNPKLFFRSVLTYSRYRYGLDGSNSSDGIITEQFGSESTMRDWTLRTGFDFFPAPAHQIRFGTEVISHAYQPSALTTTYAVNPDSLPKANNLINAWEYAVYAEDEAQPISWLKLNVGVRGAAFHVEEHTYTSLEPRLAVSFLLPAQFALKGSYTLMRQYIHLLSSSGAGFPNDIWVPSSRRVAPQFSWQLALGVTKTLPWLNTEIMVEGYHKTMTNLIDYQQGTNFLMGAYSRDWQEEIETGGIGKAYGLEIFLNRTQGRFTGWLSYALAWNQRQFINISNGNWYPARYDRRHSFSVTGNYKLANAWSLSSTWVYSSGQPVTLPVGVQEDIYGNKIFIYTGRNNARMPAYHRLDLGANYTRQTRRGRTATWSFGVYNAYSRVNPYYLDFRNKYNSSWEIIGKQMVQRSLFPLLPSFNYSLKF